MTDSRPQDGDMDVTPSIGDEGRQAWLVRARRDTLPRLNRRSVLIADDQADSIEALAILLEWSGHEVHLARDGKDAMQAAREYRPELIFLDIAMPELNGYEVCRRLRAM